MKILFTQEQLDELSAPFDIKEFYEENRGLVAKYISKNTDNYIIEDFDVPKEWYYKNNRNVISWEAQREYSIKQKLEWIKCAFDYVYFTKKYVKIISIDDGIIPFRLYDFQKEMIYSYQKNAFNITLCGRQVGKTQVVAAYILAFATFNQAKTTAVLANKGAQSKEILSRIQLSYELLPSFLKQGVRVYNKTSMTFANRSEIFSAATSPDGVRGKSISLLYGDEFAFVARDTEFYESIFPTLSSGKKSKIILTSTPNGTRGIFHKIWSESEAGLNTFARIKVTWRGVPTRDEEWKKTQIQNSSYEQFRQEHEADFRGSQNSLLSGEALEKLVTKKPIEVRDNNLKIYHRAKENHTYFMTVDTSEGIGQDSHAVSVVDVSKLPYEVVATYKTNSLPYLILPTVIDNIGREYNDAYVLVELNSQGSQVANILYWDLEYDNILMVGKEKGKQALGIGTDLHPGIKTVAGPKQLGCSTIKAMIEKDKIILNDQDIIEEFGTFVPHGKSFAADSGAHDDMVMTMVLFAWATTQRYFVDLTNNNLRENIIGGSEQDYMPFGIIDTDIQTFDGKVDTVVTDDFTDGF